MCLHIRRFPYGLFYRAKPDTAMQRSGIAVCMAESRCAQRNRGVRSGIAVCMADASQKINPQYKETL